MNALKAYRYYQAIKLHFCQEKFDVFKNRGAINISYEKFLQRNDRFLFEKLSQKYDDKSYIQLVACNFMYGHNTVLYDLNTSTTNYQTYIKRKESITHVFSSDLQYLLDNDATQPEQILQQFLGKKITLETISILNDLNNIVSTIKQSPIGLFFGPDLLRVQKSKGFVKYKLDKIQPVYFKYLEELQSSNYGTHVS